jgi:hypothetical protein
MTRTNVMASSRPQTAGTAMMRSGSSPAWRKLVILPVVLAVGLAPAAPALAAEAPLTNYEQKPNTPPATTPSPGTTPNTGTAPTSTGTTPGSGTSPSKSTKTPASTVTPAAANSAPASTAKPAKATASTLPFTGLDLRWTVGAGLLLVGAGGSIMVMQRRQRRDAGR